MTRVLAHIFNLLFSKGLGGPEEPAEDSLCDVSKTRAIWVWERVKA